MPTPEGLRPEIKDNHDGSISVQYTPSIQGRHEVQMCYEGAAIDGNIVYSVSSVLKVGYYSNGLNYDFSNSHRTFGSRHVQHLTAHSKS